jgi:ECF sigma factor
MSLAVLGTALCVAAQQNRKACPIATDDVGIEPDKPFTAERVSRSVGYFAGGTEKIVERHEFLALDSAGRIRLERRIPHDPDVVDQEGFRTTDRDGRFGGNDIGNQIALGRKGTNPEQPDPCQALSKDGRLEIHSPRSSLFEATERGERSAADVLFSALYSELHRLAKSQLARQGAPVSLGATTPLHQACIEIAARDGASFPDRLRFMGYAARVMRGLIIDHAAQPPCAETRWTV